MTTWTPTRVAALRACRRRYAFVYRDGRDEPSSPEADLGDLVHAAMEDVGRAWLAGDRPENLGVALRTAAAVHGVNYGAATVACAVSVLSAAAASPLAALDDLAAVEHELSFAAPCPACAGDSVCPICDDAGTIEATTRADRIDLPPGEGPTVIDFKTGRVRQRDELAHDPQTLLLLAAAHVTWPELPPPRLVYWYLGEPWPVTVEWSAEAEATAVALVQGAAAEAARLDAEPGPWPVAEDPTTCADCPFVPECDRGRAVRDGALLDARPGDDLPDDLGALLAARQVAKATAEAADARRKQIDERLRPLVEAGAAPVEAGGWRARWREEKQRSFDRLAAVADALARFTGEDPEEVAAEVATVDRARLDAKVAAAGEALDGPGRIALAAAVDRCASKWVKAYVRVERARGERGWRWRTR